jgi:hypothetical protein
MGLGRVVAVTAAVALCISLVGCAGGTASPSLAPTPSPAPSPTSAPSPSSGCTAGFVLTQVEQLLAGQQFEAHYLTSGDKFMLSIWLADPDINPATTQSGMAAAGRRALARGLSLSYQIVDQIPCAQRVFDEINPMIVDGRFQHWYKDFLPVGAFAGLREPTTDELIAAVEATGTALEAPRATPPQASPTSPPGSCSWSEAQAAVHAYFGAADNTAAYLIIGAGLVAQGTPAPAPVPDDVGVEVQWPVRNATEATDSQILDRLGNVAAAIACLSPGIDSLEAFVVDSSGRTLAYAIVPGAVIRAGTSPLRAGGVRVYHLAPPALP